MGHKKSKQQREAALALPRLLPKALPKAPPKTIMNSCHVTGERLRYDAQQMIVDDNDRIAYPRNPEPRDLTPHSIYATGYRVSLPSRLHTRDTEGPLGGHTYAAPFIKFLDAGQLRKGPRYASERLSRQDYAERFWWSPVWAERELRAHYPADVVDIVLSVRRDHADWDSAMVGSRRALSDVKQHMRQMADHCRVLIRQETTQAAA